MKKLNLLRDYINENQVIGRYDVIAGLKSHSIVLYEETTPTNCNCIGDDEVIIQNDANGNVSHIIKIPNSISLSPKMTLSIKQFQISMPNLHIVENKLKHHLSKLYSMNSSDVLIQGRQLQIGLHNGHTVINSELLNIPMHIVKSDDDHHHHSNNNTNSTNTDNSIADGKHDKDTIHRTNLGISNRKMSELITFDQFIAHENVALVFLLQYDIQTPKRNTNNNTNTNTNTNDTNSNGNSSQHQSQKEQEYSITTVTMGVGIYFPYIGNKITIKQHNIDLSSGNGNGNEIHHKDIQIYMNTNEALCSLLTTNPIFELPKEHGSGSGSGSGVDSGRNKDSKTSNTHTQTHAHTYAQTPLNSSTLPCATLTCTTTARLRIRDKATSGGVLVPEKCEHLHFMECSAVQYSAVHEIRVWQWWW